MAGPCCILVSTLWQSPVSQHPLEGWCGGALCVGCVPEPIAGVRVSQLWEVVS